MAGYEKGSLSKKEKAFMWAIFKHTEGTNGICLISHIELLGLLPYDMEFKLEELEPTLKALEMDDYLDFVRADRHGEMVYCVTLHQNGLNFARAVAAEKRKLRKRIIITVIMGIISATVVTLWRTVLQKLF